ncbi:MAG: hypothetical protein IJT59_00095 [Desulfovibrionaceae bacterium]|nr:hypothetical protein [Desulfovibrionaceae bacterium]
MRNVLSKKLLKISSNKTFLKRQKSINKMNDQNNEDVKVPQALSKSEIRKANDFQRRCRILDIIKDNDIVGHGYSQSKIAKMADASVGLVNKIAAFYRENPNLTYEDLHEKRRGPKPIRKRRSKK